MEGRQLISREEMTAKIRSAVHARRDPNTVLIARTDAVAVTGFDDACQRAAACRDAGADVIFVEALQTPEQVQSAAARVGAPLMANMVEQALPGHSGPPFQHGLPHRHLPGGPLYAATKAVGDLLRLLRETGDLRPCMEREVGFPAFNRMIGLEELRALEASFSPRG